MKDIRVAFFDVKPYDRKSFDEVNSKYGFEIKYFKTHLTKDSALLATGCNIVCAFVNDLIDREVILELERTGVELIALRSAGYNNVDMEAARGRVKVVRVPAYSPHAVAEHAAALILSLNRKIYKAYNRTRDNNFNISGLEGFDLFGKTAGVIGAGKIGRRMISILRGFGMKVLVYDNFEDREFEESSGCSYVSLEQIYSDSDIITLHCPLTDSTKHMINSSSIAKMKKGVMLINTSRGQLIETKSLVDNLKTEKIGFAGLDVYEEESEYFFKDFSASMVTDDVLSRLLTFNNVIITSHQGFLTEEALENIASETLASISAYAEGRELVNEVN